MNENSSTKKSDFKTRIARGRMRAGEIQIPKKIGELSTTELRVRMHALEKRKTSKGLNEKDKRNMDLEIQKIKNILRNASR